LCYGTGGRGFPDEAGRCPQPAGVEPELRRDWSSWAGAEALAAEIKHFWAAFGHDIQVWIEPARGGKDPLWIVKSTLRAACRPRGCRRIRWL